MDYAIRSARRIAQPTANRQRLSKIRKGYNPERAIHPLCRQQGEEYA
jgi:hypothetical protein